MKEIYFEMFGGAPQENTNSDRMSTLEADEPASPIKGQEEKMSDQPKKSTGFLKAMKSIFKGSSKGSSKADLNADASKPKGSLFRSVIYGASGVYESNSPDNRADELGSPSGFEHRQSQNGRARPDSLSSHRQFSPVGSPGIGGSNDFHRRVSSIPFSSSKGSIMER